VHAKQVNPAQRPVLSRYNSMSKGKQATSRGDFVSYARRVDSQLVTLMSALWTNLADNPDLLPLFMFEDRR
jgi:hypothetical protein